MAYRRVAVSQRVEVVPGYDEVRDCLDQEWTIWIESMDLCPVLVPNSLADVAAFCDTLGIEAIFLTGGNNLGGPVYDDPEVKAPGASADRDRTEAALVHYAIDRDVPLLAWCRGMQVLQVVFGGRLSKLEGAAVKHVATVHEVHVVDERWRELAGSETMRVNSFHDFGVRRHELAPSLIAVALDDSADIVEAVRHREHRIVGCQWHPERPRGSDRFNRMLVNDYLGGIDG